MHVSSAVALALWGGGGVVGLGKGDTPTWRFLFLRFSNVSQHSACSCTENHLVFIQTTLKEMYLDFLSSDVELNITLRFTMETWNPALDVLASSVRQELMEKITRNVCSQFILK